MQWKLSEEQDAYRDALRGWLGDAAAPERVREWLDADDGRGDPSTFEKRFGAEGMAGVGIAEELGGQGGGLVELALTAEELARASAPSAAWLATVLAVPALESRPDLVQAALGGATAVWLLQAGAIPGTGSALAIGAGGTVSGELPRVLAADRASVFVAVVDGTSGREVRLIDAETEGVAVRPRRLLDRTRSVADVRLEGAQSVALEVDADSCLTRVTDLAGVLVAADSLGTTQRMLDLAVDYSLQRKQFGVPIGSFQAVKHAAASILVDLEAGRSGLYYAAASVEARDPECSLHAAAVKAQVTAAGARAADTALTMHGAIGYTWEHDLHLFYKRARLDEHLFGTPSAWNERLAERLALV